MLARRLTEDPTTRVLLLEAGPRDRNPLIRIPGVAPRLMHGKFDWALTTTPQAGLEDRSLYYPRGRGLGGSSSINAQVYLRGHAADFDGWASLGNTGWAAADVTPLFESIERAFAPGCDSSQGVLPVSQQRDPHPATGAFLTAAEACGYKIADDLNRELDGFGLSPVNQRLGLRTSAAHAYLRPALSRRNLTVLTGARTLAVTFAGSRAVGVRYSHGGITKVANASEVVLSAGAVHTPQLLMLSGVGPAEHLRDIGLPVVADVPGVGANLQDHLCVAVQAVHDGAHLPALVEWLRQAGLFATRRRGRLTSNSSEACGFLRTDEGLEAPDLEIVFAPPRLWPTLPTPRWAAANMWHRVKPLLGGPPFEPRTHLLTLSPTAVQPRSHGGIRLRSDRPDHPPLIDPRSLTDPDRDDLRVLVEGVKRARELLATDPLARFAGAEVHPGPEASTDADLEGFVRRRTVSLQHPVGTARMGVDDRAVVDSELRVHGVEGLRVVDASVMPRVPRGHTHAPTTMIAEKAARMMTSRATDRGDES